MAGKVNKTLIGAFVVGAAVLAVIAVFVFGGSQWFDPKEKFVSYFEGSVKGLDVGAPVQLKGVSIGQVTDISLIVDRANMKFLNRVVFDVTPGKAVAVENLESGTLAETAPRTDTRKGIVELIDRGLRVQLDLQSVVTGKLLLAMNFDPESPLTLYRLEKDLIEVPTVPTKLEKLTQTLEDLPVEELFYDIKEAVSNIRKLVGSPMLPEAVGALQVTLENLGGVIADVRSTTVPQANATLSDYSKLARNLNTQVTPVTASITDAARQAEILLDNVNGQIEGVLRSVTAALESVRNTLDRADAAFQSVEELTEADSFIQRDLSEALNEIEKAARAVRQLAETLDTQPEVLLRGKSVQGGR